MYKFRSMDVQSPKKERGAWTVPGDPRVTKVGKIIRKTSIDELPQLFNILKGDMSLVGPRPERPFFVEKFREEIPRYMIKHQVRPGMTGWAQINGRDMLNDYDKVFYDREYLKNVSMAFDAKVFFDSVLKVLGREDIQEGVRTHHHQDEIRRHQQEQLAEEKAERNEFVQFQQEAQLVRDQRRAM